MIRRRLGANCALTLAALSVCSTAIGQLYSVSHDSTVRAGVDDNLASLGRAVGISRAGMVACAPEGGFYSCDRAVGAFAVMKRDENGHWYLARNLQSCDTEPEGYPSKVAVDEMGFALTGGGLNRADLVNGFDAYSIQLEYGGGLGIALTPRLVLVRGETYTDFYLRPTGEYVGSLNFGGFLATTGEQVMIATAAEVRIYAWDGEFLRLSSTFQPNPALDSLSYVAFDGDQVALGGYIGATGTTVIMHERDGVWTPETTIPHVGSTALRNGLLAIGKDLWTGPVGVRQGRVHIYVFDGLDWKFGEDLYSPEPRPYDRFGMSVAMDEDQLAVGAPSECERNSDGAVFVFNYAVDPCFDGPVVTQTPEDFVGCAGVPATFSVAATSQSLIQYT